MMQFNSDKPSKYFWLAILLHLLLFSLFSFVVILKPETKKMPNLFVPAYVYKEHVGTLQQPSLVASQSQQQSRQSEMKKLQQQRTPIQTVMHQEKNLSLKPQRQVTGKSLLVDSFAMLDEQQLEHIRAAAKRNQKPIYLIGDEDSPPDPLIKLIAEALSAHFAYPRLEGEMGIKGKVLIGLMFHPQGNITDVQMIRSSGNQNLDNAALYAVNSAPIVKGIERFLSTPKYFVVGYIFK